MVRRMKCKILPAALAFLYLTTALAGCGQEQTLAEPGDVELLEPVGIALNYEEATVRNLYNAKTYAAFVCPVVEEFAMESSMVLEDYDALPGETVKKGDKLLHGDTENIDKQIESLQEQIADMEESYQEYVKETNEALAQPRTDKTNNRNVLDSLEKSKPEQYITVTDESGTVTQTVNPNYTQWQNDYKKFDGLYHSATQKVMELEQALLERTQLYELDHAYYLKQLEYLKQDKAELTLTSGKAGVVVGLKMPDYTSRVEGGEPLAAVGDVSEKLLRCDYISKGIISRAEEVYAIIDGVRYEVEYVPMDDEEYRRLQEKKVTAYSTFYLKGDTEGIEMGAYASVVVVTQARRNVLTVARDAINKDENTSYVYVLDNNQAVYTPVETGMRNSMYTEITAGLKEGDKVLTNSAVTAGKETIFPETGTVGHQFSATGYLFYPSVEFVENPITYGTMYYVSCHVKLYQQVSAGEVLATVRVEADAEALGRNERKLQRERERLADLIAQQSESNEKAIAAKQESIQKLEELIAEMKADYAVREIVSPINGIVTWVYEFADESLVPNGAGLFEVSDESVSYVMVEDENNQLNFGNQAEITYTGTDNKEHVVHGEIVTVSERASSAELNSVQNERTYNQTRRALIRVPAEELGDMAGSAQGYEGWWNRSRFQVKVNIRTMNHVLLVPKNAVLEENGYTYVKVKTEDGGVHYVNFIAGGSDSSNYWVVEGLTEGMEICLE